MATTRIEDLKMVLSEGFPILTAIDDGPVLITGYDDDKQAFFSPSDTWIPYSTTFGECWYMDADVKYHLIKADEKTERSEVT